MTNRHHAIDLAAQRAAQRIFEELAMPVAESVVASAAKRIRALVDEHVADERQRCVDLCRERAELWRNTLTASSPAPYAREESRARANEAVYLADLLSGD